MIPHQVYTFQGIFKNPHYRYIFLDGAGGTGKTFTIAAWLQHIGYSHYQYVFLGPTGKSISVAEEKGMYGSTLHRFFMLETNDTTAKINAHITIKFKTIEQYYTELKKKLIDIKIMFIDEISMVNNEMLDFILKTMETIAPHIKIAFSGDFHQLPAVIDTRKLENVNLDSCLEIISGLIRTREMGKVSFITRFRSDNEDYNEWLHDLRGGQYSNSNEVADALEKWFNVYEDNTLDVEIRKQLTFLEYTGDNVDALNKSLLNELPGKIHTSKAIIVEDRYPQGKKSERDDLIRDFQMDDTVQFKQGSKILFRVNNQGGMFKNGDEGIVQEIKQSTVIITKTNGNTIEVSKHTYQPSSVEQTKGFDIQIKQWPFSLGNARTYHKSQGDGFTNLHLCLDFLGANYLFDEYKWQILYVGLSRVVDPTKVWIPRSSINMLRNQTKLFKRINWTKLSLDFESNQMYYQEYQPREI